jgi:hypothetical protein
MSAVVPIGGEAKKVMANSRAIASKFEILKKHGSFQFACASAAILRWFFAHNRPSE